LFWPSLIPRREKLISGRSLVYFAKFGAALRGKLESFRTEEKEGSKDSVSAGKLRCFCCLLLQKIVSARAPNAGDSFDFG
jgi:hypothetical protein